MLADDRSSRRFRLRVKADGGEDASNDLFVVLRLFQVLLPFFLKFRVLGASDGVGIDLLTAHFRLQRLVEKLLDLFVVHVSPRVIRIGLSLASSKVRKQQSGQRRRAAPFCEGFMAT